MTNNAEFIVIIIVAVILLIALILVCTCCWRSINILASEHGTAKREALANHLRNSFRHSIRHVESFRNNLADRRQRNRGDTRANTLNHYSDQETVISNSNNGSTFSNAHYINAMFFQTTNQSDYVNHPDVSDKHVNGSVHNGIAMNVKDLNAQYMDENHGLPVMLDPRYQPRSIQWDQYIGNKDEHSIIQKNVNNSNLSPKFSNQRPTPIGRSLTMLSHDELPNIKQSPYSSRSLHHQSGYQSAISASKGQVNTSTPNSKQGSPSEKVSPYQKYFNERFGLNPDYVGQSNFDGGTQAGTNEFIERIQLEGQAQIVHSNSHQSMHSMPTTPCKPRRNGPIGPNSHEYSRSTGSNSPRQNESTDPNSPRLNESTCPNNLRHNKSTGPNSPRQNEPNSSNNPRYRGPIGPNSPRHNDTKSSISSYEHMNKKSPPSYERYLHTTGSAQNPSNVSVFNNSRLYDKARQTSIEDFRPIQHASSTFVLHQPSAFKPTNSKNQRYTDTCNRSAQRHQIPSRSRSRSPQKSAEQSPGSNLNISSQIQLRYNEHNVICKRRYEIGEMRRAQSQEQLTESLSDDKSLQRPHHKSHTLSPRRHCSDVNSYAYPYARSANHHAVNQKPFSSVHSVSNNALNRISKESDRVFRPIKPESSQNISPHAQDRFPSNSRMPPLIQSGAWTDTTNEMLLPVPPLPPRHYLHMPDYDELIKQLKTQSVPENNNNNHIKATHLSNEYERGIFIDRVISVDPGLSLRSHQPRSRQRLNFNSTHSDANQFYDTQHSLESPQPGRASYENIPSQGLKHVALDSNHNGMVMFDNYCGDYESFI